MDCVIFLVYTIYLLLSPSNIHLWTSRLLAGQLLFAIETVGVSRDNLKSKRRLLMTYHSARGSAICSFYS